MNKNLIIISSSAHKGGSLQTNSEFVYNTKIASYKRNKRNRLNQKRFSKHPQVVK